MQEVISTTPPTWPFAQRSIPHREDPVDKNPMIAPEKTSAQQFSKDGESAQEIVGKQATTTR